MVIFVMDIFTTLCHIEFKDEQSAEYFLDILNAAEEEDNINDYGPAWLGNVLSVLGHLEDGTYTCDGYIKSAVYGGNRAVVSVEGRANPQLGAICCAMNEVDPSATLQFMTTTKDPNGLTDDAVIIYTNVVPSECPEHMNLITATGNEQ